MDNIFSEEAYEGMIKELFCRFPSFQKVGAGAYKPGIANMEFADQLMGHPHRKYKVIHVAGTNGKGSVSNMLASVLASAGLKVGLYTSPHILDFRERARIVDSSSCHPGRSEGGFLLYQDLIERGQDCRGIFRAGKAKSRRLTGGKSRGFNTASAEKNRQDVLFLSGIGITPLFTLHTKKLPPGRQIRDGGSYR